MLEEPSYINKSALEPIFLSLPSLYRHDFRNKLFYMSVDEPHCSKKKRGFNPDNENIS